MKLNDLADLVGITPQNLSVLKTGKARAIRFTTLEKLCDVLDCQPGDILEFDKPLEGGDYERAKQTNNSFIMGKDPDKSSG